MKAEQETTDSRLAKRVTPGTRSRDEILRDKFLLALDLFSDGVDMKRQSLRRQHPSESADEIEARILAWIEDRPLDGPEPFFTRGQ